MKLSQAHAVTVANASNDMGKKNLKCTGVAAATDKLKASNFPATLLRIGTWEVKAIGFEAFVLIARRM